MKYSTKKEMKRAIQETIKRESLGADENKKIQNRFAQKVQASLMILLNDAGEMGMTEGDFMVTIEEIIRIMDSYLVYSSPIKK